VPPILELAPTLLLAAYGLVALDYGILFFSRARERRRPTLALVAVWGLHLAYLVALGRALGQLPAGIVPHVLSLVAFTLAGVYLLLEWWTGDRSTGFWTVLQVAGFQSLAVLLRGPVPAEHPYFREPLFGAHVFLALLGYTAFAVGASYGFLFLSLYHELKGRRFALFYGRLPPLQVLERMMSGALVVGFLGLTGSLATGMASMLSSGASAAWVRDPMILLTACTWLLYGAALLLRRARQWQGRQTALAALAGLVVIVGSLLVVGLMLPGFHRPLS
jgi:ABC-type uncharacterized transport system permease subunit